MQAILPIDTGSHLSTAWSVCLSHLSQLCTALKASDGFTCHLASTMMHCVRCRAVNALTQCVNFFNALINA